MLNGPNYADIGQRIKKFRQKQDMPQEHLAELAEVSVSHMSHIETGQTKLSLPAIIRVANALNVSADELLCGNLMQGKTVMQNEFADLMSDCSPAEAAYILGLLKFAKKGLREAKEER